jgi:hypothetical protein
MQSSVRIFSFKKWLLHVFYNKITLLCVLSSYQDYAFFTTFFILCFCLEEIKLKYFNSFWFWIFIMKSAWTWLFYVIFIMFVWFMVCGLGGGGVWDLFLINYGSTIFLSFSHFLDSLKIYYFLVSFRILSFSLYLSILLYVSFFSWSFWGIRYIVWLPMKISIYLSFDFSLNLSLKRDFTSLFATF